MNAKEMRLIGCCRSRTGAWPI